MMQARTIIDGQQRLTALYQALTNNGDELFLVRLDDLVDSNDDVRDVSARAETLMHESMVRPDLIEGITAFFEKRPPNFPPLKQL